MIPVRIDDPVYNLLAATRKLLRTIKVMIKIQSVCACACTCVYTNKIISQELKQISALSIYVSPWRSAFNHTGPYFAP